jgi:hypothetical protein
VNTATASDQLREDVASDASGNFVVVWNSYAPGLGYDVFAQRYDATGAPRGTEFRVNTYTTGRQRLPAVASDASGNFVVVWESESQDGSGDGVFAQRFDPSGAPRGLEFKVNTYTPFTQGTPDVASDASGNLVVVWEGGDIYAQRYDAQAAPRGSEFRVNSYTTSTQATARVAVDASGNFVVVWRSTHDGSSNGIFAQRYDALGVPRGTEFRVNAYTTGAQSFAAVAADPHGNIVVAWNGAGGDVLAQRFGGLHPRLLAVDPVAAGGSDGNSVLEPGETAPVRPSWHNSIGSQQTVGGDASAFGGPPGATYTLTDGAAIYILGDGLTVPCTDCYLLGVSNPTPRPATHWDAAFLETLQPEPVHGQKKLWTLHVGDSFTDVARGNPFYRFIETLLHHGVTGGCAAGQYCPASSSTRREMAVFVLVADEGTAFAPPLCVAGSELFDDVPASSGFCPWIEELSRRGVVNGCQASPPLYCPAAAVTRAQMAVFVLATKEPGFTPPDCVSGSELFGDVPAANGFCRWIEELARRGIVSGCQASPALYCPSSPVTRAQMGVFISGTFGLSLYGP